jgi:hypothetical protein
MHKLQYAQFSRLVDAAVVQFVRETAYVALREVALSAVVCLDTTRAMCSSSTYVCVYSQRNDLVDMSLASTVSLSKLRSDMH